MEPDMSCFDMTGVELVKKKYYNAAKVNELLENIRKEFSKQAAARAELEARLEALDAQKAQISDTLMSAQTIARQMIDDAKAQAEEAARLAQAQAEETVKTAEKKAELILSGARLRKETADADVSEVQEYALRCVEACVDRLRQQHVESIEFINSQWQGFLSGLILPEDGEPAAEEEEAQKQAEQPQPADWMTIAEMELPDLEEQYADIDADTFFSGGFFNEQSGADIFQQLKTMMDSIEKHEE